MRILTCLLSICTLYLFPAKGLAFNRIISLSPPVTEDIYLLGAGDRLIGSTIYCTRPKAAEKKEKVGTIIKANIEKIVSLNPDLVLATPLTNTQDIEKLRNLGINIKVLPIPRSFSQLCRQFLEIASFLDKKEEAGKLISEVRKEVSLISQEANNHPTAPKVCVQIGAKPLFIADKESLINELILLAGGVNISRGLNNAICSREEILKANPDIIIISLMGFSGKEEKSAWEHFSFLNAVKRKQIYIFDPYSLGSPTPLSFVKTLRKIRSILHKYKQ